MAARNWRLWLIRLILLLWGLQLLWLIWYFGDEGRDLARGVAKLEVGKAIRQEEPRYRWSLALGAVIPEDATYVYLDNYEAGREIEARYFLVPRRHILVSPKAPASFLFYTLHQKGAAFLIIGDRKHPLGPGARAARHSPAFQALPLPGPGSVFRVDSALLKWGFYD